MGGWVSARVHAIECACGSGRPSAPRPPPPLPPPTHTPHPPHTPSQVAGYQHAVKRSTLDDLPDELPLGAEGGVGDASSGEEGEESDWAPEAEEAEEEGGRLAGEARVACACRVCVSWVHACRERARMPDARMCVIVCDVLRGARHAPRTPPLHPRPRAPPAQPPCLTLR